MKRIVVLGALAFVVGVVLMFPARIAYNWFAPPEIQLSGIDGTIWTGSASEGLAGGIYLRNIYWKIKPLELFKAKLAYTTKFDPAAGFIDADFAVAAGGRITLSNVNGSLPIELLQDSIQPLRGIQGSVGLQLDTVTIDDGAPTTIEGTVTVTGLTTPAFSSLPIGSYRAVFATDSSGVHGTVKDVSGVLAIDGNVVIAGDRSYSFIGQVAPRPDTPPVIIQQLQFLGSPDSAGMREFRFEGQL